MQLLRHLAQTPPGHNELNRADVTRSCPPEIARECAEAYDWLAIHGLVSVNPGGNSLGDIGTRQISCLL